MPINAPSAYPHLPVLVEATGDIILPHESQAASVASQVPPANFQAGALAARTLGGTSSVDDALRPRQPAAFGPSPTAPSLPTGMPTSLGDTGLAFLPIGAAGPAITGFVGAPFANLPAEGRGIAICMMGHYLEHYAPRLRCDPTWRVDAAVVSRSPNGPTVFRRARKAHRVLARPSRPQRSQPASLSERDRRQVESAMGICRRFDDTGKERYPSAVLYARALRAVDKGLSLEALAHAAGCAIATLADDPVLSPVKLSPLERSRLTNALQRCPTRVDGRNCYNSAEEHASALLAVDDKLTSRAIAEATGMSRTHATTLPFFASKRMDGGEEQRLADALAACRAAYPEGFDNAIDRARALRLVAPDLRDGLLALGSGAYPSAIANDPWLNPPLLNVGEPARLSLALAECHRGLATKWDALSMVKQLQAIDPTLSPAALAVASGRPVAKVRALRTASWDDLDADQQQRLTRALGDPPFQDRTVFRSARHLAHALKAHDPGLLAEALSFGSGLPLATALDDPVLHPPTLNPAERNAKAAAEQAAPRGSFPSGRAWVAGLLAHDPTLTPAVVMSITGLPRHPAVDYMREVLKSSQGQ